MAAAAAEQIDAAFGPDVFTGDAQRLLMAVYRDMRQPIGLRLAAAKAAMPFEKSRLASIETKVVHEFENMAIEELRAMTEAAARCLLQSVSKWRETPDR